MTKFAVLLAVATTLLAISVSDAHAGQKIEVGRSVPAAQQVSMDRIDHSDWHALLQKYVDNNGQVNYGALKASTEDRALLHGYLNRLSTANRSAQATPQAKLAFWINAYNAVTVEGILREYPTSSIRNHTAKLFGYNIWKDLLLHVGDTKISLNDIEHEVLRKMGEPRIHFAIVCASHSCPRLLNQAYTADKIGEQLTTNSQSFFANQENFQHDTARGQFRMSAILDWFGEDFGPDQAAQLRTLAPYLPTQQAHDAAMNNSVTVSHLEYDWSLNEQK